MARLAANLGALLIATTWMPVASQQWPTLCPNQPTDAYAQVRCPATATCGTNGFSGAANAAACCPYPRAVTCSSYQCCPEGNKCVSIGGSSYSEVFSCVPAAGGSNTTSKCTCKPGAPLKPSATLKNILIVRAALKCIQADPAKKTSHSFDSSCFYRQPLLNNLPSP